MAQSADARPRLKQLGMPEMKVLTVKLGSAYDELFGNRQFTRRGYLGYVYEVCNLSDGRRSVVDIARILDHELGPVDVELVTQMCQDLARLGILEFEI